MPGLNVQWAHQTAHLCTFPCLPHRTCATQSASGVPLRRREACRLQAVAHCLRSLLQTFLHTVSPHPHAFKLQLALLCPSRSAYFVNFIYLRMQRTRNEGVKPGNRHHANCCQNVRMHAATRAKKTVEMQQGASVQTGAERAKLVRHTAGGSSRGAGSAWLPHGKARKHPLGGHTH